MRMVSRCFLAAAVAAGTVGCGDATSRVLPMEPGVSYSGNSSSHFSPGFAVGLEPIAEGFTAPVDLAEVPDGSGRLAVVDQIGLVRIVMPDGSLHPEPFLDLRSRMVNLSPFFDERGLLGLAFHPHFATNGRLFVYYSAPRRPEAPVGWNHTSRISEFRVMLGDPNRADPGSEQVLLAVDQPQFNHNAGGVRFGPDGMLYISLGDGGGANDVGMGHTPVLGNGQDPTNLLGTILRLDVSAPGMYTIPGDNPFVGTPARGEIWAYGLRNPYRFSFDTGGGRDLLAADVGQELWEEVNVIRRGGNYGWNTREGMQCFDPAAPANPPAECPRVGAFFGDPLLDPVIAYGNRKVRPDGLGISVIGGFVYRGSALPQLTGRYVFGDWSTGFMSRDGFLLVSTPRQRGLWPIQAPRITNRPDGRLGHYLVGLGQDATGEIYLLTTDNIGPVGSTGRVYRLTNPGGQP